MEIFINLLIFLIAGAIVWFFAGLLVESVDRVARRFHQTGFTVAFFVLGFLTSISEISVMVNSTIAKTPQVSVGNLVGATFVILLFIVPFLAVIGNGVELKGILHKKNLLVALIVSLLPALFLLDGQVSWSEGIICILVYVSLLYLISRQKFITVPEIIKEVEEELVDKKRTTTLDVVKILAAGSLIFIAGHFLVTETVYFSNLLSVPNSIIGLLVLSIGTNVPELVIAARSILKKRNDIAFGDYLGSAVTNTLIFAFLPIFNGTFFVEASEFIATAILMVVGLIALYVAANSKRIISRTEGVVLLSVYVLFVIIQMVNLIRFAID